MRSIKFLGAIAGAILALGATSAMAQSNPYNSLKVVNGAPVLNICTGEEGGGYWKIGQTIANHLESNGFRGNVIATDGTTANIKGANAIKTGINPVTFRGQQYPCHIVVYQTDGTAVLTDFKSVVEKVANIYDEPVLLITRQGGNFDHIDDFEKKGNLCVRKNSGGALTIQAFAKLEDDYADVAANRVVEKRSWKECVDALNSKDGNTYEVDGIFYVGSPTSDFMQKDVDPTAGVKGTKMTLATVRDGDLDDDGVYEKVQVRSKLFKNLLGWGDRDTMSVRSAIGISKPLADMLNGKGMLDPVTTAIRNAAKKINADYARIDPLDR
jgi:hypothetical protein